MTELVLYVWVTSAYIQNKKKNKKSDEMIELELEEIPQNCIQEVELSEEPKNKQSFITSYFK